MRWQGYGDGRVRQVVASAPFRARTDDHPPFRAALRQGAVDAVADSPDAVRTRPPRPYRYRVARQPTPTVALRPAPGSK